MNILPSGYAVDKTVNKTTEKVSENTRQKVEIVDGQQKNQNKCLKINHL